MRPRGTSLQRDDAPKVAILDWMMPDIDGVEVCRASAALGRPEAPYLILLTAKDRTEDLVTGLDAGANDYLVKPFDRRELQARLRVADRVVSLQHDLAERVRELQEALGQVHQLQGLLPICSYCKKIRDDGNYWQQVEGYLSAHTGVQFSHGVCPDCYAKVLAQLEEAEATRLTAGRESETRRARNRHSPLIAARAPHRTSRTFRECALGEKGFCKAPLTSVAPSRRGISRLRVVRDCGNLGDSPARIRICCALPRYSESTSWPNRYPIETASS